MTQYNKEELINVLQLFLALFISFTFMRFLSVFALNFNPFAALGVVIGAAILYFCLKKTNHFNSFVGLTCFLSIPFSIYYIF